MKTTLATLEGRVAQLLQRDPEARRTSTRDEVEDIALWVIRRRWKPVVGDRPRRLVETVREAIFKKPADNRN